MYNNFQKKGKIMSGTAIRPLSMEALFFAAEIHLANFQAAEERASRIPLEQLAPALKDYYNHRGLPNGLSIYLLNAAQKNCKRVVDLLLQCEPGLVNAKDVDGETNLHLVVEKAGRKWDPEYAVAIPILLQVRADVNARNRFNSTPLHIATKYGQEEIALQLLQEKAEVTAEDQFGNTPLHLAAQCGSEGIVNKLLQAGADVNAQNRAGGTPLYYVCLLKPWKESIIRALFQAGADASIQQKMRGETPLRVMVDRKSTAMVRMFLSKVLPLSVLEDARKGTTDETPEIRALLNDATARRRVANALAAAFSKGSPVTSIERAARNFLFEPRVFEIVSQFLGRPSYKESPP